MKHTTRSEAETLMTLMGFKLHLSNGRFSMHTLLNKWRQIILGKWIVKIYARSMVVSYENRESKANGPITTHKVFNGPIDKGLEFLKGRYDHVNEEKSAAQGTPSSADDP